MAAARSAPGVVLAGLMTHFATADEHDDDGFFERQLETFTGWAAPLKREHPELIVHAANSAAVLRSADAHFDMVRCGISIYGMDPVRRRRRRARARARARAVLLRGRRQAPAGRDRAPATGAPSALAADTAIALLPIGYGDGWRRCSVQQRATS